MIYPGPNVITKISTFIFIIIILLPIQASNAYGQPRPTQAQVVFKLASPSIVMINVVTQDGARQGSAVAVKNSLNIESFKPDGTIFYTNWHVIQSAKSLSITVSGIQYKLEVMYADSQMDMATVKASGLFIEPVKIAKIQPKVGDNVFAIGNPRGLEATISQGIVSGRRLKNEMNLIQTTAPISPGSSGGGLFDNAGNLIGITTLRLGNPGEALNFAIPVISYEQFIEAKSTSDSIALSLKHFFTNSEKDIATAQSDDFARWLFNPEQQKIRVLFANESRNLFLGNNSQQASFNIQEATVRALEEYKKFQKASKSEPNKPDQVEKIVLICKILDWSPWTFQIDSAMGTVNGKIAKFTDYSIEFGKDDVKFLINRYVSTITAITTDGSVNGSCQRAANRAF